MKATTTRPRGSPAAAGSEKRWKVGDMPRYCSLCCARALILDTSRESYCVMFSHGVVSYVKEYDLYTLEGWLKWLEKFRDELTPKEFREYEASAKAEFVPPKWWDDAVKTAMEPFSQND
jgi:hypothetical protein